MGQCSRCGVAGIIQRYGRKNVIEIIHGTSVDDPEWRKFYDIYVLSEPDEVIVPMVTPIVNQIEFDGREYVWTMTLFSEEHSLDEDCDLYWKESRGAVDKYGFPSTRVPK